LKSASMWGTRVTKPWRMIQGFKRKRVMYIRWSLEMDCKRRGELMVWDSEGVRGERGAVCRGLEVMLLKWFSEVRAKRRCNGTRSCRGESTSSPSFRKDARASGEGR